MMPRSQSQPFIEKSVGAFASSIPDMTSSPLTHRRHNQQGEPDMERLPTPPPPQVYNDNDIHILHLVV